MFINHTTKQVIAKIVYYGTGLSGKTTNLQYIFSITNPESRGEFVSMETDIERTLFFDLLPLNVGSINGYQIKFQLYTVPGQIFYDSTRKLVLKGADGIVFIGDSQELMSQGNIDSFENLKKNLLEHNININTIPLVLQYNKRDITNILSIDELNNKLNTLKVPYFEAIATKGDGVINTLKSISSMTLTKIKKEIDSNSEPQKNPVTVNFDTDNKKKIRRIEEIPQKVITSDNADELDLQIEIESDSKDYKIQNIVDKNEEVKDANSEKVTVFSKQNLDILNSITDNTRKTIIKKVKFTSMKNIINISNSDSTIIDSFELNIDEQTEKITIILDVEK